jgi:RNA-directed DNA polymerase
LTGLLAVQEESFVASYVVHGYDELKAILHNCRKNGPDTQNRAGLRDFRAHLEGRFAWVEQVNALRGQRLRRIFDEIRW